MKKYILFLLLFVYNGYAQFNFERSWGTYLGDERFVFADSKIDRDGNIYIAGWIKGNDLTNILSFTNANSYQQSYGGGETDGFVIKLNSNGEIVWGTFFGGDDNDRITAIEIDKNDNLYLLGTTSSTTNIATVGSIQEQYGGGDRDAFLSKFNTTGDLEWSTYYGGMSQEGDLSLGSQLSSISFDGNNSIYVIFSASSEGLATEDTFQSTLLPENITLGSNASASILAKFDTTGNRIWATYYGIYWSFMIKANENGVYLTSMTQDCPPNGIYNTYYGTTGAYQPIPASCRDIVLTKFDIEGQRVWSTYYGGSSVEGFTGKNTIDLRGDTIYFTGNAVNYNNQEIATTGSYLSNVVGASNFIVQFNDDCTRNFGTYNGSGNSAAGLTTNVLVGEEVNLFYNYGTTGYTQNIATTDGYKTGVNGTGKDAFICKFDSESEKKWGTYYGGELDEINAQFHYYSNGTKFYVVGSTQSYTQIASANGLQPNKEVFDSENPQSEYVLFIAHFAPSSLSNESFGQNSFSLYPNPSKDILHLKVKNEIGVKSVSVYNTLGQIVMAITNVDNLKSIDVSSLTAGSYFVKVYTDKGSSSNKFIKQ